MKKLIALPAFLLINILLDSVVFTKLNAFGIRPDSVIAVASVIAIASGSWAGTAYAMAAGLLFDILFGKYLGLMPLIYMFPVMTAGLFYRRFYADNNLFPCIVAGVLDIVKELLFIVFLLIMQIPFSFFNTLWRYLIPSALLTAALAWPVNVVYRKLNLGQLHPIRYR